VKIGKEYSHNHLTTDLFINCPVSTVTVMQLS